MKLRLQLARNTSFIILLLLVNALYTTAQSTRSRGGVVITLDDHSVREWLTADSIIAQQYKWKVTFFVSGFGRLNDQQRNGLLQLQRNGHEIAYHGASHLNVTSYLDTHSFEEYKKEELSQLLPMKELGLRVSSFAYPSGGRSTQTDSLLSPFFSMLRGVTDKKHADQDLGCFYNNAPLVNGIGMEKKYPYFSNEYLLNLLQYARDNNKILVLYSHKPVPVADKTKHEVEYATLMLICDYVTKNKMRFFTMNELGRP